MFRLFFKKDSIDEDILTNFVFMIVKGKHNIHIDFD